MSVYYCMPSSAYKESNKILYYVRNQQDATLAVSFISHCKITLHVSDAFWIYIIPTHDQWLLLQFLVLLMMDAESVRNM